MKILLLFYICFLSFACSNKNNSLNYLEHQDLTLFEGSNLEWRRDQLYFRNDSTMVLLFFDSTTIVKDSILSGQVNEREKKHFFTVASLFQIIAGKYQVYRVTGSKGVVKFKHFSDEYEIICKGDKGSNWKCKEALLTK